MSISITADHVPFMNLQRNQMETETERDIFKKMKVGVTDVIEQAGFKQYMYLGTADIIFEPQDFINRKLNNAHSWNNQES